MPRRTRVPALLAALAAVLLAALASTAVAAPSASAAARCANATVSPAEHPRAARAATLCLLNRERAARGLHALHASTPLARAAVRHSSDMVRRRFFAHTAPGDVTFVERIQRARYAPRGAWTVGENLAWGTGALATPARIVRGWMHSPAHRANVLNGAFRAIGIGIVRGVPVDASAAAARSGAVYTTNFGSD